MLDLYSIWPWFDIRLMPVVCRGCTTEPLTWSSHGPSLGDSTLAPAHPTEKDSNERALSFKVTTVKLTGELQHVCAKFLQK